MIRKDKNDYNCIVHSGDCMSCTWNWAGTSCKTSVSCETCTNTDCEGTCHCLQEANENDEHCPYYKKEE